jgi:hypothetical protein
MEPRPFVRVAVSGLGLRIPVSSKASRGGVHAAASPCTCEISLPNFPKETVPISLVAPTTARVPEANNAAASFYLDEAALEKLLIPSWMRRKKTPALKVRVYLGKQKLGTFKLPVSLDWAEGKPNVLYSGWTCIGDAKAESGSAAGAELHVEVKVEADPRYMFQFEKVTALSPQIIQVSSKNKQSIFSCKFSRDKLSRCRVGAGDISSSSGALEGREKRKERKGWLVMVHDLSGSPVAAASMVTPFVPATGSDYVARSNPGAWLILRPETPGAGSWRPWGRLEAWREKGGKGVGSRFQLLSETGAMQSGVLTSETLFSAKKGGEFTIDVRKFKQELSPVESRSPSPRSSGELSSFGLGLQGVGEFVMSCGVRGDRDSSKPLVQVAMRHVTCVEDVAVFIALAAAVDLSVDACQPFRRRLRKELGEVLSSSS